MQEFMMLNLPSDLWTYFNRGPTALFGVQPVAVQIPHVRELFDNLGKDLTWICIHVRITSKFR